MTYEIDNIKLLLGIEDDEADKLLRLLKSNAARAICLFLRSTYLPLDLEWVADEVAITRYGLINSESIKAESTDLSRFDYKDDIFEQYLPILEQYRDDHRDEFGGGRRLRML